MHENALFVLKNCKNRPALGHPLTRPLLSPATGGFATRLSPYPLPPLRIPGYAIVHCNRCDSVSFKTKNSYYILSETCRNIGQLILFNFLSFFFLICFGLIAQNGIFLDILCFLFSTSPSTLHGNCNCHYHGRIKTWAQNYFARMF